MDEANHINLINRQNEVVRIGFEDGLPADEESASKKNLAPVGGIKFDAAINELNEQLKISLIDTDFKEKLLEKISSFYCRGK